MALALQPQPHGGRCGRIPLGNIKYRHRGWTAFPGFDRHHPAAIGQRINLFQAHGGYFCGFGVIDERYRPPGR